MRLSAKGERLRVSAPKGTLTTTLREQIANHKQEILALLRSGAATFNANSVIRPVGSNDPSPLSFAQQRLWFLDQFETHSSVFNLCRAFRISGPLHLRALEASLNEILRRHEALRTKFMLVDGLPLLTVASVEYLTIPLLDLPVRSEGERQSQSRRLILEETKRPFDLPEGRLLRVRLLRVGEDKYLLMFVTHHLVADAWSMGIFMRELWSFYDDYRNGRQPRLPAPACRYRDYALWQRQRLQDEILQSQLLYWKGRLAGVPVLDLPSDRPRASKQSFEGARVEFAIPKQLTGALNELSKREGATLFMTLLAAFQVLLHRYSGQEDIVVGTPVANRDRIEFENLIGLFVNTLALRANLSGAPSFKEALRRVREVCLDAYAHQKIPFEKVVEELHPQRELNRNPLFQVMFVLQNTPRHAARPADLTVDSIEVDGGTAQFDLSLYLRERSGRLLGFFEYATDLFERRAIERMTAHFQKVLEEIATDPYQSIATLSLLNDAERQRLLIEWNDTQANYPGSACIHELFEAQAKRTPDAIALEFGDDKMTYEELNRRSDRLAGELAHFGVGPEKLVGVMVERSFELIISLLGIFKAGGAYLPLDPTYPKERLSFMLNDAEASVLITQRRYSSYLFNYYGKVLVIDESVQNERVAKPIPNSGVGPDNAAYVIYTSGSTGTPKGVVGLHRGAVNRFNWMWMTYPFSAGEKCCLKTSLSFVDSVWEIFGALLQGVPTVIIPEPIAMEPELLTRYLGAHRVTRLVLVPSLLRELLAQGEVLRKRLARLRFCISSGEVLTAELARRFRELLPNCRLINLYGSSEVAGDVTSYEVDGDPHDSSIPIGRPIANTQVYVLDPSLQAVPLGVRGELYVGGANLARGYLRRRDLTEQRFIENPFSITKTARLYRTGDLVRYRADGNMEFLGRMDNQVKIRGCRVELAEVEAVLASHPAVRECAVIAREENSHASRAHENSDSTNADGNGFRLVAYVVARDSRPGFHQLRSFLAEKLPDYMIPSDFVLLDGLPWLPNGKLDRRALEQSNIAPFSSSKIIERARTEIESLIAAVWEGVLKVQNIGAADNFFELGGHSLLAAQVVARLREAFSKPITLRDLFAAPTVAGLARAVESTLRADRAEKLPPITPAPCKGPMPVSRAQEQLFLFSQLFGGGDFLNMPYAYRLNGPLDVAALERSIGEIVRRHEVLRSCFREEPRGPVQSVRRRVRIHLPLIDLSTLPEKQRQIKLEEISRKDADRSFDVEEAPLFRTKLLRLADDEHVLLITFHHLICDQWSTAVFRRELAALYRAFSKGMPSPLKDLPVQFTDWVRWQREILKNDFLDRQIEYWRNQLSGPSAPLNLHGGKKAAKSVHYRSARHPIEIGPVLLARINSLAHEHNCTPFMILIAALNLLLHRRTGQTDIRIATLSANRGPDGTEDLIGYLVNTLVLRTRLRADMSNVDLLKTVREVCLEAYAHQDVPFEHLESLLHSGREERRRPLYQVMLNYRNFSSPAEQAGGLTIASWSGKNRAADPGIGISRLDVNIHLHEVSTKLTGAVNYKTDLFDQRAIAEFVASYIHILADMTERSGRQFSR